MRQGVSSLSWQAETLAYVQAVDKDGRFLDLCAGHADTSIMINDESVLVRPDAAVRQQEADAAAEREPTDQGGRISTPPGEQPPLGGDGLNGAGGLTAAGTTITGSGAVMAPAAKLPRRFYGVVELDPTRLNK